ncbi:MAG TPA: hypothetical protein VFS30_00340 [Dehalococcoidia bacterium]|nr:hypothetical protein [Dehalococcoidia bacterium]
MSDTMLTQDYPHADRWRNETRFLTPPAVEEEPGWPSGIGDSPLSSLRDAPTAHAVVRGSRLFVSFTRRQPVWLESVVRGLVGLMVLPSDWDSYGACPVEPAAAETSINVLGRVMAESTPSPQIVPTVTGGVQLEWHLGGVDLEIAIRPSGDAHVLFEDLGSGEEWEGWLPDFVSEVRKVLAQLATP